MVMDASGAGGVGARDYAVGIDIGGTKIAVGMVDRDGGCIARGEVPTESASGPGRALERMMGLIERLERSAGLGREGLRGVGIGCAGPVNPYQGTVHNPFTLPGWEDWGIVRALGGALGKPVYLENDADAAALGECWLGAGRGCNPVVMLTLGTGVGGAVVVGGRVGRGVDGEHPELGHVPVAAGGPLCYCGRAGCLESVASGTAIGEAGRAWGWEDSRGVLAAAGAGDPRAVGIVTRAVDALETATWTLLHAYLPERIVVGGGMAEEHFEVLAVGMRRAVGLAAMAPRGRVEVVRAELGQSAGVLGGARLVWAGGLDHGWDGLGGWGGSD